MASIGLREPQLVRLDQETQLSKDLRIGYFLLRSNEKVAALLYLVRSIIPDDQLTIVFTATKHHSEYIHGLLQKLVSCVHVYMYVLSKGICIYVYIANGIRV